MATNMKLLEKGLRHLGFLILLFIVSPIALSFSYKALSIYKEGGKHIMAIVFLVISCILILFTVFFAFKTFKIILNAIFDSK
jgi:glucan phosphoethanolaminetransferase (alkaline phosphatase superfamily)